MTMSKLLACLPTVYYLSTRYNYAHKRIIFLLKYWGSYIVLALLFDVILVLEESLNLCLSFLIFNNLYDYFCYENDNYLVNSEKDAVRRMWNSSVSFAQFLTIKVLLGLALNALLYASATERDFLYVCAVQVALILVFAIHNRIRVPIRPITFFLLYLLKGLVFGVLFLDALGNKELLVYFAFTFVYSMSYMPKYMFRKLKRTPTDTIAEAGGIAKYVIMQPIFYKNLFLLLFACYYVNAIWVLLYIDTLTGIELLFDMVNRRYKGSPVYIP